MSDSVFSSLRRLNPPGTFVQNTTWNGAAFLYGLAALYAPSRIVEVGCSGGVSASYLCSALMDHGSGLYRGYEIDEQAKSEALLKLNALWPNGDWELHGDFFSEYSGKEVDFAFIDIEPKGRYVESYEHLKLSDSAVIVAHDLDLEWSHGDVLRLKVRLEEDGFKAFTVHRERGFLVGIR